MIHTLGAQKKLRAASKRAHGPESVAFASRLEEQSGSGRGREQRMLILRGCEKPGPRQDCTDCKWFIVIPLQRTGTDVCVPL